METEYIKCNGCKCKRHINEYEVYKGERRKSCIICKENRQKNKCEHLKRKSQCKECGGSQICEHSRERSKCKDCGGGSICEHSRIRHSCKECGGGSICEHSRQRSSCKDCGGGSICEHSRERSKCKECGGSSICEHSRERSKCKDCGGGSICEHSRIRSKCKECGGGSICEHSRIRSRCKECNFMLCLINIQRGQIRRCLQHSNLNKTKHSIEYLGCDVEYFKSYMEKKMTEGMNWDNIHIDHIKPVSRFNLDDEEEFLKCCHYTNLQPLLAKDNMEKGNKWSEEEEENWNTKIIYNEFY
jgi:hypothetical protein